MIEKAIGKIVDLAVKANSVKEFRPCAEPSHVYFLAKPDGSVERFVAEPQLRNHEVKSVQSLASLAVQFIGVKDNTVSLWVEGNRAILIHDESDRRERTTLGFAYSKQHSLIAAWENCVTWHTAAELMRILRSTFNGTDVAALVGALSKVRFAKSSENDVEVSLGKASLGKKLSADLKTGSVLPPSIHLYYDVYSGDGAIIHAGASCDVDVDLENEKFAIIPFAGTTANNTAEAESQIIKRYSEQVRELLNINDNVELHVYKGKP